MEYYPDGAIVLNIMIIKGMITEIIVITAVLTGVGDGIGVGGPISHSAALVIKPR